MGSKTGKMGEPGGATWCRQRDDSADASTESWHGALYPANLVLQRITVVF